MAAMYQNKYRVSSARADWHEYDGGTYFVTICTASKKHYFGEIISEQGEHKMMLTAIGRCVEENLKSVTTHYPDAEIPLFVVMPNHIHAIVVVHPVETMCTSSPCRQAGIEVSAAKEDVFGERMCTSSVHGKMQDISRHRGRLSVVVGGLKRAVTHFANQQAVPFAWLPRYHDRIVRGRDELNRIANYIEHNVANWSADELNVEEEM